MLEVDLDLVVAADISQYLAADGVGGKLVVLGDQVDAHTAMFSILLGFQSEHQKLGAVLLMSLLKNDVAAFLLIILLPDVSFGPVILEHLPSITDLTFSVKTMDLGHFSVTEMSNMMFLRTRKCLVVFKLG